MRIYIHIPFCVRKCPYCNFVSFAVKDKSVHERYAEDLCNELKLWREKFEEEGIEHERVISVYFGGGTPSLLSAYLLDMILNCVRKYFPDFHPSAEITIEVNPGTVERGSLRDYREIGFNRVSIGIQSFDDRVLKFLGRIHTGKEALETLKEAEKYFDKINSDIIWGVENDTLERIEKDLEIATIYSNHISAYSLIVERGTPLHEMYERGKVRLPADDVIGEWYIAIHDYLLSMGFTHYEISNFALPKNFSIHNWGYWMRDSYLGTGISAHGFFSEREKRYFNVSSLRNYFEKIESGNLPVKEMEKLDEKSIITEKIMLGLRTYLGIRKGILPEKASLAEKVREFIELGLLEIHGNHIRIPYSNWSRADAIIRELVSEI